MVVVNERVPVRAGIELFGFQKGPTGFVKRGTVERADLSLWRDRLFLLAHGGRASGKSAAGAYRMMNYMLAWPGALGIATAPIFRTVWSATLPAFLRVLEEAGLRSGEHYQYAGKREEVEFCNGSRLMFMTTEHPDTLPGPSIACLWMDEPRRSPFEAYRLLAPCLRQEGYPHQAWLTTTPAGRQHWLYDLFYGGLERPIGEYVGYPARTIENPHGGLEVALQIVADYGGTVRVEHIHAEEEGCRRPWECYHFENLPPLTRQELNGEFVLASELVYDCWDRERLVVPMEQWPTRPQDMRWVYAGLDYGWRNPSSLVVEGLDKQGNFYILEAVRKSHMDLEAFAALCYRSLKRWGIQRFYPDPSEPQSTATLKKMRFAGEAPGWRLPLQATRKTRLRLDDPTSGIGLCYKALSRRADDGRPMFYVHPEALPFIEDIESYIVKDGQAGRDLPERPREEHHDIMDAWMYAHAALSRRLWLGDPSQIRSFRFSFDAPQLSIGRRGSYA